MAFPYVHIHFPYGYFFFFNVQMWELDHKEGWAPSFKLVLEKTPQGSLKDLTVPWTARRWNQSILKEVNPENSLEGLMLKLKLQYFGHLMQRADSLKKTLMLGKTKVRRRRRWQVKDEMGLKGHEFEQTLGDSEGQGSLGCCSPWVAKVRHWLSN